MAEFHLVHCSYGIQLCFDQEPLLNGRRIFHVQNYLSKCRQQKQKGINYSFNLFFTICSLLRVFVCVCVLM